MMSRSVRTDIAKAISLILIFAMLLQTIPIAAVLQTPVANALSNVPIENTEGGKFYYGTQALLQLAFALMLTDNALAAQYMFALLDTIDAKVKLCENYYSILENAKKEPQSIAEVLPDSTTMQDAKNKTQWAKDNIEDAKYYYDYYAQDSALTDIELNMVSKYVVNALGHLVKDDNGAYDILSKAINDYAYALESLYHDVKNKYDGPVSIVLGIKELEERGANIENLKTESIAIAQKFDYIRENLVDNIALGVQITDNLLGLHDYLITVSGKVDNLYNNMIEMMKRYVSVTQTPFSEKHNREINVDNYSTIRSIVNVYNPFVEFSLDNVYVKVSGPNGSVIHYKGSTNNIVPVENTLKADGSREYTLSLDLAPYSLPEICVDYTSILAHSLDNGWSQVGPAIAGQNVIFGKSLTIFKDNSISYLAESDNWTFSKKIEPSSTTATITSVTSNRNPVAFSDNTISMRIIGKDNSIYVICSDAPVKYEIIRSGYDHYRSRYYLDFAITNNSSIGYENIIVKTGVAAPSDMSIISGSWPKGMPENENGTVVIKIPSMSSGEELTYSLEFNFLPQVQLYTITVDVNPAGAGTVIGIDNYTSGESVCLIAIPNQNYKFLNWSGDISTSNNPAIFIMQSRDMNIMANFEYIPDGYNVTVVSNPDIGGTVVGGGAWNLGDTVRIIAIPNENYGFAGWSGYLSGDNNPTSFTMPPENVTIIANFTDDLNQIKTYELKVQISPVGYGTVNGYDDTFTLYVKSGIPVILAASANYTYSFENWSGYLFENVNPIAFIMPSDNVDITANFTQPTPIGPPNYYVSANSNLPHLGYVSGTGSFREGDNVTLTAILAPGVTGYSFSRWTGHLTTENNPLTFKMPAHDVSLTAIFSRNYPTENMEKWLLETLRIVTERYQNLKDNVENLEDSYFKSDLLLGLQEVYEKILDAADYIAKRDYSSAYTTLIAIMHALQRIQDELNSLIAGIAVVTTYGWSPIGVVPVDEKIQVINISTIYNLSATPIEYSFKKDIPPYLPLENVRVYLDLKEILPTPLVDNTIELTLLMGANESRVVSITGITTLATSTSSGFSQSYNMVFSDVQPVSVESEYSVSYNQSLIKGVTTRLKKEIPSKTFYAGSISVLSKYYTYYYTLGLVRNGQKYSFSLDYSNVANPDNISVLFKEPFPVSSVKSDVSFDNSRHIWYVTTIGTITNPSDTDYENIFIIKNSLRGNKNTFVVSPSASFVVWEIDPREDNTAIPYAAANSISKRSSMDYMLRYDLDNFASSIYDYYNRIVNIRDNLKIMATVVENIGENISLIDELIENASDHIDGGNLENAYNLLLTADRAIIDLANYVRNIQERISNYHNLENMTSILLSNLHLLIDVLNENRDVQKGVKETLLSVAAEGNIKRRSAAELFNDKEYGFAISELQLAMLNITKARHDAENTLWQWGVNELVSLKVDVTNYVTIRNMLIGKGIPVAELDSALADLDVTLRHVSYAQKRAFLEQFVMLLNSALDIKENIDAAIEKYLENIYNSLYSNVSNKIAILTSLRDSMSAENVAHIAVQIISDTLSKISPDFKTADDYGKQGKYSKGIRILKKVYNEIDYAIFSISEPILNWFDEFSDTVLDDIDYFHSLIDWIRKTGGTVSYDIIASINLLKENIGNVRRYDDVISFALLAVEVKCQYDNVSKTVLSVAEAHRTSLLKTLTDVINLLNDTKGSIERNISILRKAVPHDVDKHRFSEVRDIAKRSGISLLLYTHTSLAACTLLSSQVAEIIKIVSQSVDNAKNLPIIDFLILYGDIKENIDINAYTSNVIHSKISNDVYKAKARVGRVQNQAFVAVEDYEGDRKEDITWWYRLSLDCSDENELYGALVYAAAVIAMSEDEALILTRPPPDITGIIIAVIVVLGAICVFFVFRRRRKIKLKEKPTAEAIPALSEPTQA